MILGTARYMSPEQARAVPADRRADIWAFGTSSTRCSPAGARSGRNGGRDAGEGARARAGLAARGRRGRRPPSRRCSSAAWPRVRASVCRPSATRGSSSRRRCRAWRSGNRGGSSPAAEPIERSRARGSARRRLGVALVGALHPRACWYGRSSPRCAPDHAMRRWPTPPMRLSDRAGRRGVRHRSRLGRGVLGRRQEDRVRERGGDPGAPSTRAVSTRSHRSSSTLARPPVLVPTTRSSRRMGSWVGYVTPSELRKVKVGGGTPVKICNVSRSRGAAWLARRQIVIAPVLRGLAWRGCPPRVASSLR